MDKIIKIVQVKDLFVLTGDGGDEHYMDIMDSWVYTEDGFRHALGLLDKFIGEETIDRWVVPADGPSPTGETWGKLYERLSHEEIKVNTSVRVSEIMTRQRQRHDDRMEQGSANTPPPAGTVS